MGFAEFSAICVSSQDLFGGRFMSVKSVHKALQVLEAVAKEPGGITGAGG